MKSAPNPLRDLSEACSKAESTTDSSRSNSSDFEADKTPGQDVWWDLTRQIASCHACSLARNRETAFKFQEIQKNYDVLFVADTVSKEGAIFRIEEEQLFLKMVSAMRLPRESWILVPGLFCPIGTEIREWEAPTKTCGRLNLSKIIDYIQPRVVVALGPVAHRSLFPTDQLVAFDYLRGTWKPRKGTIPDADANVMTTFHPRHLLRDQSQKGTCWRDLKLVMEALGLLNPTR